MEIYDIFKNFFRRTDNKENFYVKEMVRCHNLKCPGEIVKRTKFYSCTEFPDCRCVIDNDLYENYSKKFTVIRKYKPKINEYPRHYAVIDFETTGLNPKQDRIIEVAAIEFRDGVEVNKFNELIKIHHPLSPAVIRLTGITSDMLVNCRQEREVMDDLSKFTKLIPLLVAHNAKFDMLFYGYSIRRLNLPKWQGEVICTYKNARAVFTSRQGNSMKHRLVDVCTYLDIPFYKGHRAMEDAQATALVLEKLWPKICSHGVTPELPVRDLVRDGHLDIAFEEEYK